MSSKRRLACEFNLTALRADAPRLYMWTYTFAHFATPEQQRENIRQLVQFLNRLGCSGVRVYEAHKSGSLHVHIVLDRYVVAGRMRAWTREHGFGRIHCKFLNPQDTGSYIAKELGKAKQAIRSAGVRVYATFGKAWERIGKSLIANIESGSERSLFFKEKFALGFSFTQARLAWWDNLRKGIGFPEFVVGMKLAT